MKRTFLQRLKTYVLITGLTLLLFTGIELLSGKENPFREKPADMKIQLTLVVFITSLVLFTVIEFFIPWYQKKLIRKLQHTFPDSFFIGPNTLCASDTDDFTILFHIKRGIKTHAELVIIYKGANQKTLSHLKKNYTFLPQEKEHSFSILTFDLEQTHVYASVMELVKEFSKM